MGLFFGIFAQRSSSFQPVHANSCKNWKQPGSVCGFERLSACALKVTGYDLESEYHVYY